MDFIDDSSDEWYPVLNRWPKMCCFFIPTSTGIRLSGGVEIIQLTYCINAIFYVEQ